MPAFSFSICEIFWGWCGSRKSRAEVIMVVSMRYSRVGEKYFRSDPAPSGFTGRVRGMDDVYLFIVFLRLCAVAATLENLKHIHHTTLSVNEWFHV